MTIETDGAGRNAELRVLLQKSRVPRVNAQRISKPLRSKTVSSAFPTHRALRALNAADAALDLKRSTFWGPVTCREVEASDCIFMREVTAERTQVGCVRFSYLAPGSNVPRPFRCQPQLAIGAETNPAAKEMIARRVRPLFESMNPAHPAYARLHAHGPEEIRRGGENRDRNGCLLQPRGAAP